MNVIIGLGRSFSRKVGTFQESLMLVTQAFVDVPSTSSGFYWQLTMRYKHQSLLKGTHFSTYYRVLLIWLSHNINCQPN